MENNWKEWVGIGIMLMLVCLGIGGCFYLMGKGIAMTEAPKQIQDKQSWP